MFRKAPRGAAAWEKANMKLVSGLKSLPEVWVWEAFLLFPVTWPALLAATSLVDKP